MGKIESYREASRRKIARARSAPGAGLVSDEENQSMADITTHTSKTVPTQKRRMRWTMAQGLTALVGTCCIVATISVSPFAVVSLTQGSIIESGTKTLEKVSKRSSVRGGRRTMEVAAKPVQKGDVDGVEYYMQLPSEPFDEPSAILFLAHGCGGKATQYWKNSDDCPECLGIPEQSAIVEMALERGMIPVSISSEDRKQSCWLNRDGQRVAQVLDKLAEEYPSLPIFAFGSSSGGEQVGRFLPNCMRNEDGSNRLNGIISENKVPRDTYDTDIPAFYIKLPNDPEVAEEIDAFASKRNGPTQQIQLPPFKVDEAFFHTRLPERISPDLSADIYQRAKEAGLLSDDDTVSDNPTGGSGQDKWLTALSDLSQGGDGPLAGNEWTLVDELNVAWGVHATVRDGVDTGLDWLFLTYHMNKPIPSDDEDGVTEGSTDEGSEEGSDQEDSVEEGSDQEGSASEETDEATAESLKSVTVKAKTPAVAVVTKKENTKAIKETSKPKLAAAIKNVGAPVKRALVAKTAVADVKAAVKPAVVAKSASVQEEIVPEAKKPCKNETHHWFFDKDKPDPAAKAVPTPAIKAVVTKSASVQEEIVPEAKKPCKNETHHWFFDKNKSDLATKAATAPAVKKAVVAKTTPTVAKAVTATTAAKKVATVAASKAKTVVQPKTTPKLTAKTPPKAATVAVKKTTPVAAKATAASAKTPTKIAAAKQKAA